MPHYLLVLILTLFSFKSFAQKPKNGTYTYTIAFAEQQGKSFGATCTVIINGDSIKAVHNGKPGISGKKGEVMDEGIIMKHKTGVWIIGHSRKDIHAEEFGGCSDGPTEIDFRRKKWWTC